MRSLFARQKPRRRCPKFYVLIRFRWVQQMDRLTGGLSRSQLCFSLILFTILGTGLNLYLALKGFLPASHHSLQIDAVTVIKPVYKDCNAVLLSLNISAKKDRKQTELGRYIDSVINLSAAADLCPNTNSIGREIWSSPITGENNTGNDKKQKDGKQNTYIKRKK